MKRSIITTADGSTSLKIDAWDEPYHSRHGAVQESQHVFIKEGLAKRDTPEVAILELGFGTGLNALLSYDYAKAHSRNITYCGVEAFPLTAAEVSEMNYAAQLADKELKKIFTKLHQAPANEWIAIDTFFSFKRVEKRFEVLEETRQFDLIYHDAFSPKLQPELWDEKVFEKGFSLLRSGGMLVTYSAKGSVRRAMESVGFVVEKVPGPPGKREMIRANKT
ncbi:MAG: tRNA (5-methylaminomethyl-2-thiouridine)(34)-methyltransferase MnmD [Bacteroidia bacterium]|nr:tRNA (5-methylaminomethyl-2-thiouridine)(34)-methyltransferase MnmD [Bacteroidia bacterium]